MPSPRSVALALALALTPALLPGTALAQDNGGLVQTGRTQYDNLQFEEAVQTLSAAIIRRGNTPAQEAQIYEYLGLSYLALSRDDEAEGAFRLMLARDPERRLDASTAPRIVEFFNRARDRWVAEGRPGVAQADVPPRAARPVTIQHTSPPQHARNSDLELTASLTDPDRRSAGLVLAWRSGSRGLFHRAAAQNRAGTFAATVPAAEVRPPVVEYYLEAVDENGIAVAARGDAYAPLRVVVPADESPSVLTRWWFWTGAAVLVAGVAVGSYFIFRDTTEEPARLTINLGEGM
ncbi:MAG: tetratricopeptide repeat protein [Polyangiales bacterium]